MAFEKFLNEQVEAIAQKLFEEEKERFTKKIDQLYKEFTGFDVEMYCSRIEVLRQLQTIFLETARIENVPKKHIKNTIYQVALKKYLKTIQDQPENKDGKTKTK
jgi:hypothetical protein